MTEYDLAAAAVKHSLASAQFVGWRGNKEPNVAYFYVPVYFEFMREQTVDVHQN